MKKATSNAKYAPKRSVKKEKGKSIRKYLLYGVVIAMLAYLITIVYIMLDQQQSSIGTATSETTAESDDVPASDSAKLQVIKENCELEAYKDGKVYIKDPCDLESTLKPQFKDKYGYEYTD